MKKKYRKGAMMSPMYGMGAMLKKYMGGGMMEYPGGGMMEYPGGGLVPKQYDNGGPLTRAEARELAKQFEETGELTPQMEELLYSDMSENERQFVSDFISSGRGSSDSVFGNMVESALKGNQPLRFADNFRSEYLKDSEGEVTADNLKRKYDLYGKEGEILEEGRDKSVPLFRPGSKISRNRLVKSDDLLFPLAKGAKRGYSTPEPVQDTRREETVQDTRREDPVDPVTPRKPVVVRKDPERKLERTFRAELPEVVITAGGDPEVRRDRTGGIPIGDLLAMPSDYTGSGGADRAGGPFAQEKLSKAQLFEALRAMQNRYGGFPFMKKKSRYRR